MNILIIEDEIPAREKLRRLAEEYGVAKHGAEMRIVGEADSVRDAARLIPETSPNLILMDIQLSDGVAFEIFERCSVDAPVIFTTAFDEYLTEAFAHNGIDYLLKPIQREKFYKALEKYERLQSHFKQQEDIQQKERIQAVVQQIYREVSLPKSGTYKERIVVQKGREYVSLNVDDIAYCYTENRIVSVIARYGERYFTDKNVADLEAELDPKMFFRLNRKYLSHIEAIHSFKPESKGKIIVELLPKPDEIVLVSQERAALFRAWMEQ
jgi:two-component system LytT family response regulator